MASTWSESLDSLLETYERIGEEIPQLLRYQSLFHDNHYVRKALELIYGDILEFHKRALRFFKRPSRFLCAALPTRIPLIPVLQLGSSCFALRGKPLKPNSSTS